LTKIVLICSKKKEKKNMQMVNKILSFIIILNMFSNILICTASTDTQDSMYEEAITTLISLNILSCDEDGSFKPEDTVTKAEFIDMIVRMLGLEAVSNTGINGMRFKDVPDTYWAANSINIASDMGLISGEGYNLFKPEEIITYMQAIKIIVCALGYDMLAEKQGGYPTGYLTIASQKGITKKLSVRLDEPAKRGGIAQLIFNSLEVDLMRKIEYGQSTRLSSTDGETILSEYLHIEKKTGIVTANSNTRLVGLSTLGDDEVEIDRVIYKVGSTNAQDFLGYNVIFYAKKDKQTNESTIVFIKPNTAKNDELIIDANDLLRDHSSFTKTTIPYHDKNGKIQIARVSDVADIIFNGVVDDVFDMNDLKPLSGELKLVDNNQDGVYDVILVTSYEYLVVDKLDFLDLTVYDKYDNSKKLELDPNSSDYKLKILKDGRELTFRRLKEWDVLSILRSKNSSGKQLINVTVTSKSVKGVVSATFDDKIIIDDIEYKIASNYKDEISVGDNATFFLNDKGEIAAVNYSASEKKYAYLLNASASEGLNQTAEFKIFNTKGQIDVLKSADSLRFNGDKVTDYNTMLSDLLKTGRNAGKFGQLIIYDINSNNEIISIDTVLDKEDAKLKLSVPKTRNLNYKTSSCTFQGVVNIDDKTTIFLIPSDDEMEKAFRIVKRNYFKNDGKYTLEAYNMSEVGVAEVLIVEDNNTFDLKTTCAVVDKISYTVNEKGATVQKLYALRDGKEVSVLVEEGRTLSGIKRGDVIRYGVNSVNELNNIDLVFSFNKDKIFELVNVNANSYIAEERRVYGRVEAKRGNYFKATIKKTDGTTVQEYYGVQAAKIYMYDVKKDKVSVISASDIFDGDMIFMRVRYGDPKEIVVYRND